MEQFDFVADRIPFQLNNYGLLKTKLRMHVSLYVLV